MNDLISKFIDNELDLDEKIGFVDRVHRERPFKDESIELLEMEKIIRADVVDRMPPLKVEIKQKRFFSGLQSIGFWIPAVAAAALISFFILYHPRQDMTAAHRFIIYRPDVKNVEIAGSFSGWRRLPLKRIGSSGYWEATIKLPYGEHRFTYILNGAKRFADPTVPVREFDDFGGTNSILSLDSKT
jgi:hypothetical protein